MHIDIMQHCDTSITDDVSQVCPPSDAGGKKGVGNYLPIAYSACFILSGNNKLACVSGLLAGKIFVGYMIISHPVS